jgi:hypothetical protein
LIVGVDAMGLQTVIWIILFFTVLIIVAVFLASPIYIVMVGEDVDFLKALKLTMSFTWRRAMTYLGITLILFIVLIVLGMIPQIGLYLSFVTVTLENLAVGDLYTQHKEHVEW